MEDNIIGKTGSTLVDLNLEISNVVLLNQNLIQQPVIAADPVFSIITSSNKELLLEEEIEVFPNPTTGQLTINAGNLQINQIELFNLVGQQIYRESIKKKSTYSCNFSWIENGVFVLKINSSKGILVKKIMITND